MQWRAKANKVLAGAGVSVTAQTGRVNHGAVAEDEVEVRKVVSALAQSRHLLRVLVIVLAHLHCRGMVRSHHIVHVAGASRLIASMMVVVHDSNHAVGAFPRIGWRLDYSLVRTRTVKCTQG